MTSDPLSLPVIPMMSERLAALEKRTAPKAKTVIDRIKDRGESYRSFLPLQPARPAESGRAMEAVLPDAQH
jgi:hypothetical protein